MKPLRKNSYSKGMNKDMFQSFQKFQTFQTLKFLRTLRRWNGWSVLNGSLIKCAAREVVRRS